MMQISLINKEMWKFITSYTSCHLITPIGLSVTVFILCFPEGVYDSLPHTFTLRLLICLSERILYSDEKCFHLSASNFQSCKLKDMVMTIYHYCWWIPQCLALFYLFPYCMLHEIDLCVMQRKYCLYVVM